MNIYDKSKEKKNYFQPPNEHCLVITWDKLPWNCSYLVIEVVPNEDEEPKLITLGLFPEAEQAWVFAKAELNRRGKAVNTIYATIMEAVELIRLWHGMGMPKEAEEKAWQIYWSQSPEMKKIKDGIHVLNKLYPYEV